MLKTLKRRLIGICMLIVLCAVGMATVSSYLTVRQHAEAQVRQQLTELGNAQAQAMGAWISKQEDIVNALTPLVDVPDPSAALHQARASGRLEYAYIGHADKRMLSVPHEDLPPDFDPTSRPWYQLAASAKRVVATEPYQDAGSKKLVLSFARAIERGGKTVAVAGTDVAPDDVVQVLKSIKPTPHGLAFLLDAQGRILAHPDAELTFKPLQSMLPKLDAKALAQSLSHQGDLVIAHDGRRGLILESTRVPGSDWVLVLAADQGEALASLSDLLRNAAVTLVAVGLLGAGAVMLAVQLLLRRLTVVRRAMHGIADGEGDLTQRLADAGQDEFSDIARAFNRFVLKIAEVMGGVRAASQLIATAAREIALGNVDLRQRTAASATNLAQTAAALGALSGTLRKGAASVRSAQTLAAQAADAAQRGGGVMDQVVSTMGAINQASTRITDIITTIDGIAFQTNILALNAAVEAARAGDQGRGFAVVAAEVRALAQRSASAAREIKGLIGASVDSAERGAQQVQVAGATMHEIVQGVQDLSGLMKALSSSAQEQEQGLHELNTAVGQLDQMTQQNAALVEQSAAAAESLRLQTGTLETLVAQFKLTE